METAVFGAGPGFRVMGRSQDAIGWRRFMEGMISKEILPLQEDHITLGHGKLTLDQWAQGLVIKLPEVMHGKWLYRNIHVHDATAGVADTARRRRSNSLSKIKRIWEEMDWMRGTTIYWTSTQHYWLLQIEAARRERALMDENQNNNNSRNTQRGGRA